MDKPEEDTNSKRHMVTVDSSRVANCDWCGTIESEKWRQYIFGGNYCSRACMQAGTYSQLICSALILLLIPVLLLMVPLAIGITVNPEMWLNLGFLFLICWPFGFFALIQVAKTGSYREATPKNSRSPF
jgi:hypothetical protein